MGRGKFAAFLNDSNVRETITGRYLSLRISHLGERGYVEGMTYTIRPLIVVKRSTMRGDRFRVALGQLTGLEEAG